MSSFQVGAAHISAMLTFARLTKVYLPDFNGGYGYCEKDEQLTAIGRELESFNDIASEWGDGSSNYVFKFDKNVEAFFKANVKGCAAHMTNMIFCYDYQCDRAASYQVESVALVTRRILDAAVKILSAGYGDLTYNYIGKFKGQ